MSDRSWINTPLADIARQLVADATAQLPVGSRLIPDDAVVVVRQNSVEVRVHAPNPYGKRLPGYPEAVPRG